VVLEFTPQGGGGVMGADRIAEVSAPYLWLRYLVFKVRCLGGPNVRNSNETAPRDWRRLYTILPAEEGMATGAR